MGCIWAVPLKAIIRTDIIDASAFVMWAPLMPKFIIVMKHEHYRTN